MVFLFKFSQLGKSELGFFRRFGTRMKLLAWNVQGFENKTTRQHLRELIRENDPDIIFLSETKIKDRKMENFTKPMSYPNHLYVKPISLSVGLYLLWKIAYILI